VMAFTTSGGPIAGAGRREGPPRPSRPAAEARRMPKWRPFPRRVVAWHGRMVPQPRPGLPAHETYGTVRYGSVRYGTVGYGTGRRERSMRGVPGAARSGDGAAGPGGAAAAAPRLRGVLHAAAFPAAAVAGVALTALGPTQPARLAAAVYSVTCMA